MTKSQNPKGGQGSDSQMLNKCQSQTFTGKKRRKKKKGEGGERKNVCGGKEYK